MAHNKNPLVTKYTDCHSTNGVKFQLLLKHCCISARYWFFFCFSVLYIDFQCLSDDIIVTGENCISTANQMNFGFCSLTVFFFFPFFSFKSNAIFWWFWSVFFPGDFNVKQPTLLTDPQGFEYYLVTGIVGIYNDHY